jgi:ATP-dependent exoDNAse (exonuclease V) alpha subunit
MSTELGRRCRGAADAEHDGNAGPKRVEYVGAELWEVELAWATTVHKAQGSESKAVVVVLSTGHRPLLTRRLLYTGRGPSQHICTPVQLISMA